MVKKLPPIEVFQIRIVDLLRSITWADHTLSWIAIHVDEALENYIPLNQNEYE
jgi:hypothetical protein